MCFWCGWPTDVSVHDVFSVRSGSCSELERRKLSFPESLTQVQDEHLNEGPAFVSQTKAAMARDAARDPQRVAHERDVNERAVAVCMHSLFPQRWRRPKRYDARGVV